MLHSGWGKGKGGGGHRLEHVFGRRGSKLHVLEITSDGLTGTIPRIQITACITIVSFFSCVHAVNNTLLVPPPKKKKQKKNPTTPKQTKTKKHICIAEFFLLNFRILQNNQIYKSSAIKIYILIKV